MKIRFILHILMLLFVSNKITNAQVVLGAKDFPSTEGMVFITEDDTSGSLNVEVGLPGENQVWTLEHPFPCIHSTQHIVAVTTTPYFNSFSETNLVIQYDGVLGSQINSYYFNDIAGTFYSYQKKQQHRIELQGLGVNSATFTGPIQFEPAILYFDLPLEYGKTWKSVSTFSISIDTTFFGMPTTLVAQIQDSLVSTVDGWGIIKLPEATFNCVRVKSYFTLDEKLYMSGELFKENKSRTINYFWVAEAYGVVAKVMSQLDETDDNFTDAAQISRLHSFNSSSRIVAKQKMPKEFTLNVNFPNPFNKTTLIPFQINKSGRIKIEIYNLTGQRIKTVTNRFYSAGNHQIQWDGTNSLNEIVPSGIYFLKMHARDNNFFASRKVIFIH